MDQSHVAWAVGGAVLSWWVVGQREPVKPELPACHCVCSVKEPRESGDSGYWLLGAVVILAGLLGAHLFLAFRLSVKQVSSSEREYTLSFKGKSGKGIYGASKGLQLLDR